MPAHYCNTISTENSNPDLIRQAVNAVIEDMHGSGYTFLSSTYLPDFKLLLMYWSGDVTPQPRDQLP